MTSQASQKVLELLLHRHLWNSKTHILPLQKCEGKEETQKEAAEILDEIVFNFESAIWF